MLFRVYKRKVKEGKEVMKVKLVCNGKAQHEDFHLFLKFFSWFWKAVAFSKDHQFALYKVERIER
jgi:hypothetical protein